MDAIRSIKDITAERVASWKTDRIVRLLHSQEREDIMIEAFENELFDTPNQSKITPHELIYAFSVDPELVQAILPEIKKIIEYWDRSIIKDWNDKVAPTYLHELRYIEKL